MDSLEELPPSFPLLIMAARINIIFSMFHRSRHLTDTAISENSYFHNSRSMVGLKILNFPAASLSKHAFCAI
jgi:hypothetical protein